jgi:hypothetical protein
VQQHFRAIPTFRDDVAMRRSTNLAGAHPGDSEP